MNSQRQRFVDWCIHQLGKPVIWNTNGPDTFDCSGLVVCGLREVGVLKRTEDLNCKMMAEKWEPVRDPEPGDVALYGKEKPVHVAVVLASGGVVSASGATERITTLELAARYKAFVKRFRTHLYRDDFRCFLRVPFDGEDDEPNVA